MPGGGWIVKDGANSISGGLSSDTVAENDTISAAQMIPAGYSTVIVRKLTIASGSKLLLGSLSLLRIL